MCGTEERVSRMSEVCWHCLRCHWYCDDVLEECRGQSEPCHEFKLCTEDIEKMQNKFEDRLVNVNDVIEAVDKHTREDETLDEDISVILEEVKTAFDKEKVIEELKGEIELCVTHPLYPGRYIKKSRTIKIVEKGGIE